MADTLPEKAYFEEHQRGGTNTVCFLPHMQENVNLKFYITYICNIVDTLLSC